MPPDHGAAVVREVLKDDALRADWRAELDGIRAHIKSARAMLAAQRQFHAHAFDRRPERHVFDAAAQRSADCYAARDARHLRDRRRASTSPACVKRIFRASSKLARGGLGRVHRQQIVRRDGLALAIGDDDIPAHFALIGLAQGLSFTVSTTWIASPGFTGLTKRRLSSHREQLQPDRDR
ncbi:MAG: hypothetical protein R3C16_05325 [Hyphomonadaceae bacterium]